MQSDYRVPCLSIMETQASGTAKLPIYKPIPNPEEVRVRSRGRLLNHLVPIIALCDDCIKTAFQNAFVDGKSFLVLFEIQNAARTSAFRWFRAGLFYLSCYWAASAIIRM